jgi:hypothetical protein
MSENKGKKIKDIIEKSDLGNDNNKLIISPARNDETKEIAILSSELDKLYEDIKTLYSKPIYNYSIISSLVASLDDKTNTFNALSMIGKIYTLNELINLLKCNTRKTADLSLIGLAEAAGVLKISNKLSNCQLISQSITGYYEKVIYKVE